MLQIKSFHFSESEPLTPWFALWKILPRILPGVFEYPAQCTESVWRKRLPVVPSTALAEADSPSAVAIAVAFE